MVEKKKTKWDLEAERKQECHRQLQVFIADCTMPWIKARTTLFHIFNFYKKYCKATEQPQMIANITVFGKYFAQYYPWLKQKGKPKYVCLLKEDVFVPVEDNSTVEDN